ncbi:MAG TPA: hypothetical protein VN452_04610 [Longilinea sp.]|nr:hypothetical protein [Longilinea sp.]
MVRVILRGIRFITPWLLRILWATLNVVGTAIASLWVGVPTATRRIAERWVEIAVTAGFPTEFDQPLYFMGRFVAFLTIVAGWIATAYITVFLLRWIFHL